jgi:oxygen-independent coproporphyrinogen-3 oxidase
MNHAVYLHIPFCVHRCAYCDFNTYAGQEPLIPAYVKALCREIETVAAAAPETVPVHTIFFGGGTPSLVSSSGLSAIMDSLRTAFALSSDLEASLEANPGTVSPEYLTQLREVGFNRISFGVQSSHPDELRQLERVHDFFDVIQSVKWARQAGFDNLSLDLIFGLPEQRLDRWQETVRRAADLGPEHLSLYALTLEHGTPFGRWAQQGLLPIPDPDLAAEMYEWAGEYLEAAGYRQYEISNWAKPGRQCRHNLQYWRNLPYFGFGAGAHGFIDRLRVANVLRIKTYLERLEAPQVAKYPLSPAMVNRQPITERVEMQETMMTGLRLTHEGVSTKGFKSRFGVKMNEIFGQEIEQLLSLGLLEYAKIETSESSKPSEVLRLTKHGRLLGNQIFMRFVGD